MKQKWTSCHDILSYHDKKFHDKLYKISPYRGSPGVHVMTLAIAGLFNFCLITSKFIYQRSCLIAYYFIKVYHATWWYTLCIYSTIGNGEVADSNLQYIHRWLASTTHVLCYLVPVEWSQVQCRKSCWVFWHLWGSLDGWVVMACPVQSILLLSGNMGSPVQSQTYPHSP